MSNLNLSGKRVLITQADLFMGPALCEVFSRHGATVVASTALLVDVDAPAEILAKAGHIDILVANLAIEALSPAVAEVTEEEWSGAFAALVHPLPRLCRAVVPAMTAAVQANPRFQERLKREVPLGRLLGADEDAEFAACLCSASASRFVGQVFPVCDGWVTR